MRGEVLNAGPGISPVEKNRPMLVSIHIARSAVMGFCLALLTFVPIEAYGQLKECAVLYKTYKDNQTANPTLAYESAKEFLRRCPNTDRNVKKWIDAFEKSAYERPPAQTETSSKPTRADGGETQAPLTNAGVGRYYALVIGNDSYQHAPLLKTAVHDARVIDSILRDRYGFETKLMLNASRQEIFQAISHYRRNANEDDSLLVYYAGHGYFDRETDKAYWLPVDARLEDSANWVSADDITSNVRAVPARHILIVSDSCYSGTIYRDLGLAVATTEATARDRFLQKLLAGKSRTLMASGGNEPVSDGGGDGHSVFARAFLTGLTKMDRGSFTASELFRDFVQERVAGKANQTPEYNPLRNSGHESGDFVFVRKGAFINRSGPDVPDKLAELRKPDTAQAWLVIKGINADSLTEKELKVRVTAKVNGVEYVYPSLEGVKWMQVGPEMSPQRFKLSPTAGAYEVSFVMEGIYKNAPFKMLSQWVEQVSKLPFSGKYNLHTFDIRSATRSATVSASIEYEIHTGP